MRPYSGPLRLFPCNGATTNANPRTGRRRQSGMTLVEVTVASMIFAMIMLAVVTAMRTFGQSYERLQQITDQTPQKREVDRFLRQALRDALPEAGYFDGATEWLEWVAPVDRVGSAGGLQHLKLEASGSNLMLRFAPFDRFGDPQDEPAWGAAVESVALIDDLEQLRVYYRMLPEEDWARGPERPQKTRSKAPCRGLFSLRWRQEELWPPIIVASTIR